MDIYSILHTSMEKEHGMERISSFSLACLLACSLPSFLLSFLPISSLLSKGDLSIHPSFGGAGTSLSFSLPGYAYSGSPAEIYEIMRTNGERRRSGRRDIITPKYDSLRFAPWKGFLLQWKHINIIAVGNIRSLVRTLEWGFFLYPPSSLSWIDLSINVLCIVLHCSSTQYMAAAVKKEKKLMLSSIF